MATIPYLPGFTVKPNSIDPLGVVTFTDETVGGPAHQDNEIQPNQLQCEAYGYTYNTALGTCSIARYNTNLNRVVSNENNRTYGSGNSTETGTNNSLVMGENNTVKGFSRNNIIIGSNNEIANGVNNACVYGTRAEATVDNSIVLGGNAGADILGERQYTILMYGKQTTTSGTSASYLNSITDNYFKIENDTAFFFRCDVLAVRTGGTATGDVGDFASWTEQGVVTSMMDGEDVRIGRSRVTLASGGSVAGWRPTATVSGTDFVVNVKGKANAEIEWVITVKMTQLKTA